MIDNGKEYILCAAIRRKQPREGSPYWEGTNDIMNIEIGYRHHDIFQRFQGEVSRSPKDQGFYTSKGRFVDREEAAYIALLAGQIDVEKCFKFKCLEDGSAIRTLRPLYSEDLY